VLERTDRVWVSDCIDPLERQDMHRWTTQLIPPELLGSHVASARSHPTGRRHDLDFRASTAVVEGGALICGDHAASGQALVGEVQPDDVTAEQHTAMLLERADPAGVVSLGRIRLPGLAADQRYRSGP
jgi:alpha-galactosidase